MVYSHARVAAFTRNTFCIIMATHAASFLRYKIGQPKAVAGGGYQLLIQPSACPLLLHKILPFNFIKWTLKTTSLFSFGKPLCFLGACAKQI